MKTAKGFARWQFIVLIILLSSVVSACANVRQGVSWPALELVTINDQPRVLVIFDGRVEAIDPYQGGQLHVVRDADGEVVRNEDGNVREWIIDGGQLDGAQFFVDPILDGESFLFPTYNDRIIEVDIDTAQANPAGIATLTDGVIANVVLDDGLMYVPYRSGDLVALDRETYVEEWRFETNEGVWASPLLLDGILYFGTIDHNLYALDASTGRSVWDMPADLEGAIASTPLFYDGFLYVGSYSHNLYQIDLNGNIVNSFEGKNWIWGTPVIRDDVLYYTDLSGYVYALNPSDLSVIWEQRPANRGIRSAPIVTEDFVVVASRSGTVYWLNLETGSTVQSAEVENTPELLSDILYLPADEEQGRPELVLVGSADNGRLVSAFNMETFSLQWVYGR